MKSIIVSWLLSIAFVILGLLNLYFDHIEDCHFDIIVACIWLIIFKIELIELKTQTHE